MDLSIIILNYRQQGLVRQCLRGVLLAQPTCAYEVIVVDNNSSDGCLEMVAEQFPWAVRISSPVNLGFGAGNNLGIRAARGTYCLILNPDIVFFPGQVDQLYRFLAANPRVGVVGPRLLSPDGRAQESCRRFPRLFTPLYRRTMLGRLPLARRQLDWFMMRDFDHAESRPVDWLMGACLLIRRSALDAMGGFDQRFFLYFEDLDFCRRCWQHGWEVWYVATVAPVHHHQRLSASAGGWSVMLQPAAWQHLRSALRYYRKYAGQPLPSASPSGQEETAGVR